MTNPQDPFAAPGGEPTPGSQPPAYGQPPASQPPVYGQPPASQLPVYGQPPASQPPAYGQSPAYGQPPAYGQAATGWSGPPLASWGNRLLGALIDSGIAFVIYIVGFGLGAAVGGTLGGLLILVGYLGALAFSIWNLIEQGRTGQTLGKKQMGTRLLREQDGQVVGAGLSIGRNFLHVVDSIPCFVGYLWPIWDAKRQTFADKILKTVVVAK